MTLIDLLILVLIVIVFVWAARYIVTTLFPPDSHMILLFVAGVLLLIFLFSQFGGYNDLHLWRRWR